MEQYTGYLKPKRHYTKTPDVWRRTTAVGSAGSFATQVRCYLKGATIQYPSASLFLSLQNGNGGVFCRLEGPADLEALGQWFLECAQQVQARYIEQSAQAQAISEHLAKLQGGLDQQTRDLFTLAQTDPAKAQAVIRGILATATSNEEHSEYSHT